MSRKTGSQPQHVWPAPAELELDLTQTSGQTRPGPSPHQSGRLSAARAWSFGQTAAPHRAHTLTLQPMPACQPAGEATHRDRLPVSGAPGSANSTRHNHLRLAGGSPRSQASQGQGLGHLLSLPPNPRLLGARPASARERPVLQEKALPRLLCILSLTEARATGQRQEGPRRKPSTYVQSLHVGCKKGASLLPPGQPVPRR